VYFTIIDMVQWHHLIVVIHACLELDSRLSLAGAQLVGRWAVGSTGPIARAFFATVPES
jgi:hypothetical protein